MLCSGRCGGRLKVGGGREGEGEGGRERGREGEGEEEGFVHLYSPFNR